MARRPAAPKRPTPVESITHDDKRPNIPTADAREFVGPEVQQIRQVVFERDATLDPQLVWRGKYPDNDPAKASNLTSDAPPIYIQEKIDPRVMIENLRRTAREDNDEPELTLFDTFDGLDELEAVEFYRHQANWSNRMILGDSLQVMSSLAEREDLRGKLQMIYIDPPYGIKFGSNWQVSARRRDVKDGKLDDAAREAEQIKAFRDTWELGIHSYLTYLWDRLLVARDLLTDSGSCFVQIGDENVHLVRSVMDEVFGSENFVSQIAFKTTSGAGSFAGGTNVLASIFDHVLWYAKDRDAVRYRQLFHDKGVGLAGGGQYTWVEDAHGNRRRGTRDELESGDFRVLRPAPFTSQTTRVGQTTVFPIEWEGKTYRPSKGGWKTNRAGAQKLAAADRLLGIGDTLTYVRYLDDFPAFPINNFWEDTVTSGFSDPKIYVVQTNSKVIERCMLMATDPGDLVLDPTCGSGTTAYVAERWGRRWITVDTSRVALALARQRLMGARFPYYLLADSEKGRAKEQEASQKLLPPAPTSNDIRQGFVLERVQHVTLKAIANNPEIVEGMTREQINKAIAKYADYELLHDRPYEDKNTVRVAGPFTVESLSPHRSLAFAGAEQPITATERAGTVDGEGPTFEQTILENLRRAGVQNGRTSERISFRALDPHGGTYIQAVGERIGGDRPLRIAISIGPQYGIVSPGFIKDAAREAIRAEEVDLLCVLGFAFDPQALGVHLEDGVTVETGEAGFAEVAGERQLGKVKVLLVRMNVDLLMGEDLKKTGVGNLFTVFGEPDLKLTETADGQLVVELLGVDVYDPTSGEVRSRGADQIALWMIDTAYNEESFFVRHCYFTGGNDPYKRLKTALKAEIDEDAWASLYSTVSRPFPKPDTGKIAIKVINDYGDEVMKVFDLD